MWTGLDITGTIGGENGEILVDEEYNNACRIALEKCERYHAITFGIYEAMMHITFSDINHHQEMYNAMKKDLQEFIDKETSYDDELDFYEMFTTKY